MNKSIVNVYVHVFGGHMFVSYVYIGMGLQYYKIGICLALEDAAHLCSKMVAGVLTPTNNV